MRKSSLSRACSCPETVLLHRQMSKANDNFDEDFSKAIEAWRRKHQLRDGDPVVLCLELFRIHQDHWDRIRRKEFPSFSEFRDSLTQLQQQAPESSFSVRALRALRNINAPMRPLHGSIRRRFNP